MYLQDKRYVPTVINAESIKMITRKLVGKGDYRMDYTKVLCAELKLNPNQVENTIKLIDDGNTIPFIARYRKEMTGSMDDQTLRILADRLEYLRALDARRDEVRVHIEEQGALTEELANQLSKAVTLTEIDDIYRPFRPKRKTRASVAREKGLEPLAIAIFAQIPASPMPEKLAMEYMNPELGVETLEVALAGASDIIAEQISDDAAIRRRLRALFLEEGVVGAKAVKEEDSVYRLYYDFTEPVRKIAGHRTLAIDRGEREGFLKASVSLQNERGLEAVSAAVLKKNTPCTQFVATAAADAYNRLLIPSIEREIRNQLTDEAAEAAIKLFALNLRQLLLQPPVKGEVILGLDPAYRTGCKFAIVDDTGRVQDTGVVYPTPPHNKTEEAKATLTRLIKKHGVTVISIGNGTASRETEIFAVDLIAAQDSKLSYMVVNEAGASVYSASKLAAEEFPNFDVSLRSAVSIARRLQDPLAELVKIDPKAIGVGQYQHDMPQKRLGESLEGVVEDCVNSVGVNLNTASPALLSHVAGINASVAKSVVVFREENGAFTARAQLKKVPKLGPKAFEQCAGFLRVAESKNVLDNTAVHPESYPAAKALLGLCGYTLENVQNGGIGEIKNRVSALGEANCAEQIGVGLPTLRDIITELLRPGRDPRDELPKPMLRTDIMSMTDLKEGMELMGTIRNVIDFGAFVDIGVHEDGLVHISQLSDRFIKHPSEVVRVGDIVKVRVLSVDTGKKRISLTMKGLSPL